MKAVNINRVAFVCLTLIKKVVIDTSKEYIGKTCPYCKTRFTEGDTVVFCSTCDMPHHLSCWQENKGCTTFGCTGSIKEIIENHPKAARTPVTAQPAPAGTRQEKPAPAVKGRGEKPVEMLCESREMAFLADVPLVLENTALIIDRIQDKLYARCTFRSIAEKPIKAVLVEIFCQDVWGNAVGEPVTFQYLDLVTKRDSKFGQTSRIELADKNTRNIRVTVKKVLFEDDVVDSNGDVAFTVPAPILLSEYLRSEALAAEYARETVPAAQFVPTEAGKYWLCTCGALNAETEESCHNCGWEKEQLIAALNAATLQANLEEYEQAQKKAAEKAAAAKAEKARRAAEEKKRKQQKKARERELARQMEQERKRKIATLVSLAAAFVVFCLVVFLLVPALRYNNALAMLDDGRYDAAYQQFVDLGDFMDSADMAKEARYRKAGAELKEENFDTAISLYERLGSYRDSESKVVEATISKGDKHKKDGNYREAYEIFMGIKDEEGVDGHIQATILLWQAEAMSSDDRTLTETFVNVVTLEESQYDMFYTTILLFLNGHEDGNYWYNAGATNQTMNVSQMLEMLPTSYEDTATLVKLFNYLNNDCEAMFEDDLDFVKKCWSLGFMKDLATNDDFITYFLRGYWTGSGYYISFYESKNGGTSCEYTLPWVAKPSGTKYYDIEDMIYYHDGSNNNHLAKVYRFKIVDFDTIEVYCYKNNRTYTLYR